MQGLGLGLGLGLDLVGLGLGLELGLGLGQILLCANESGVEHTHKDTEQAPCPIGLRHNKYRFYI